MTSTTDARSGAGAGRPRATPQQVGRRRQQAEQPQAEQRRDPRQAERQSDERQSDRRQNGGRQGDRRQADPRGSDPRGSDPRQSETQPRQSDQRPVEFWPTSSIRAALETDDLTVWQRIVVAIKRDPYGRTARQVEEVLETARPYGVSKALAEVLDRTRELLEDNECAEVARHVHVLLQRSGLAQQEFASRIGIPNDEFAAYLSGSTSPAASLMIRMRRLSDRFAKMRNGND